MSATPELSPAPQRTPVPSRSMVHDVKFRGLAYQVIVVGGVVAMGAFFLVNAQNALDRQGISTGFDFLLEQAGFDIGESLIRQDSSDSFLRAYVVATLNTLWVAAAGIVLATSIGVVVGLSRLSGNPLIRMLASGYVELFRNTPQLLQVIFWYTLITHLPHPRQAWWIADSIVLSNRGVAFPWPEDGALFGWMLAAAVLGGVLSVLLVRRAEQREPRTALAGGLARLSPALVVIAPACVWRLAGSAGALSFPELRGFNFQGGVTVSPEFLGIVLGLSLYIAAFIAEIVRSGVQSVDRGQIEAAQAINLSRMAIIRRVVFPQALRVMVPPAAGQYVSVVKNSSLGVAIGYPELFNVNNTIITLSGHTVEAIAIMMSIYLAISFSIAALMNLYNRLVQLKER